MKKLYIGYDLGDGETTVNYSFREVGAVRGGRKAIIENADMPDRGGTGEALPTTYAFDEEGAVVFFHAIMTEPEDLHDIQANFKRRPTDRDLIQADEGTILRLCQTGDRAWPKDSSFCGKELTDFRDRVVTFTNAIFQHEDFQKKLKYSIAQFSGELQEIVVTVGHPTKWNEADCALYRKILQQSILGEKTYLGKPLQLVVAGESRAAYLYVRDGSEDSSRLRDKVLLIDVGSSTVDVTAVQGSKADSAYNNGHNYLGARIIDWLILEWVLDMTKKKSPEDYEKYMGLVRTEPNREKGLLVACRDAKEKLYGSSSAKVRIVFLDQINVKLERSQLNDLVDYGPIGNVMERHLNFPADVVRKVGNHSWRQEFEAFLTEQREALRRQGFQVESIILTGSASKMPVVPETVQSVFGMGNATFFESEPDKSISKGLVLVGCSNDKSEDFQKDAVELIEDIPYIIELALPELAEDLSELLANHICYSIALPALNEWKQGKLKTVQDALNKIERSCSEENLSRFITENQTCQEKIQSWLTDKVGRDISLQMQVLARKYGVQLSIDELNTMAMGAGKGLSVGAFGGNMADSVLQPAQVLIGIVSVVTGIIAAVVTPTILGVILGILILITDTVGFVLLDVLLMIPGIGWTILLALVGLGVAVAAKNGLSGAKKTVSDKLIDADLPVIVRKAVSDSKLKSSIDEQFLTICKEIKDGILEADATSTLGREIQRTLEKQINAALDEIKYIIESK